MSQQTTHPSIEVLKTLHQLKDLDSPSLQALSDRLQVASAPRNTRLLELGSNDTDTLYLLDGDVELSAADGATFTISAQDRAAKQPLCQLRPTRYQVKALSNVLYLRIARGILDDYLPLEQHSSMFEHESYSVVETIIDAESESQEVLISQVIDALFEGRLVLPSLNIVAQKVGRAILKAGDDPRKLSQAIMVDPALAAKAIKAVNSNLLADEKPVNTCEEAVERLGVDKIASLAVNCAFRETMRQPRPEIAKRMKKWWERSMRVSAISYVLARLSERFDPNLAALAGLLHRVGEAAILGYANEADPPLDAHQLDTVIREHSAELSRDLLSMWNLAPELLVVVSESGNLMRQHHYQADYADIVLVAERHADIGHGNTSLVPLDQMPAFHRLGLSEASPEFSLQIVEAAKHAMEKANTVLAA